MSQFTRFTPTRRRKGYTPATPATLRQREMPNTDVSQLSQSTIHGDNNTVSHESQLSRPDIVTLKEIPETVEELLSVDARALMATLKRDNRSAVASLAEWMKIPVRPCVLCRYYTFSSSYCECLGLKMLEPRRDCRCEFFRARSGGWHTTRLLLSIVSFTDQPIAMGPA